ncbi:MAG: hypothetical protein RQ731_00525 [Anaerosomatales bacterium]|nr:hypothetical protein [Anaerosomatales bacterium]MDT8433237.1 hypothetical protein [Anaerosomatales bacterium]
MIRPSFRLPLWAAVALPAAAYVLRSLIRGGDFAPDLPGDAIAYGLLALVVLAVWLARTRSADSVDDELPGEVDEEHDSPGEER